MELGIKVSHVMTKNIISVNAGINIKEAAKKLMVSETSSLVVTRGTDIVGIITDKDFLKLATLEEPPEIVDAIMTKNPVTINADSDIVNAAKVMGKHNIRHLLVEEHGRIVGVISLKDIKIVPDAIQRFLTSREITP